TPARRQPTPTSARPSAAVSTARTSTPSKSNTGTTWLAYVQTRTVAKATTASYIESLTPPANAIREHQITCHPTPPPALYKHAPVCDHQSVADIHHKVRDSIVR